MTNFQLISRVNVVQNTIEDQQLLGWDIEKLKERKGSDELYTDVVYTGETAAKATEAHQGRGKYVKYKGIKEERQGLVATGSLHHYGYC